MIEDVLNDLRETKALIENLSNQQYGQSIELLSGASISMHVRHIIEFYQATLSNGANICYDNRQRSKRIEQDVQLGIGTLDTIIGILEARPMNRSIMLMVNVSKSENLTRLKSSFYRELFYCLEHSIHHKAIIKIGLTTMGLEGIVLPAFGIAPATIKFQASQTA